MQRICRLIGRYSCFALFLLLAACGLPEDAKKAAGNLSDEIKKAEGFVTEREQALGATFLAEPEFKMYADREEWNKKFDAARGDLVRVKDIVLKEIDPILKRDKREDVAALLAHIKRAEGIIGDARQTARYPSVRLAFLQETRVNTNTLIVEAPQLYAAIEGGQRAVSAAVSRYQSAFPSRRDDIAARAGQATVIYETSREAGLQVSAQAERQRARQALDYAALGDGHKKLQDLRPQMEAARQKVEQELSGLPKSYSKILIDMKDEYFACVSRTSWQESESIEYPSETVFNYPCVPVSDEAYETAGDFDDADNEVAKHYYSWGSWKTSLYTMRDVTEPDVQELWKELNLDPLLSWPRNDNEGTFWVRETKAHFYHRYAYVENGVRRDGEWEEVNPDLYHKHEAHLGMALVEKPSGKFENEVITDASPVGMALVGDERAGKWETRGGNTVWIWGGPFQSSYGGFYGPGWSGYSRSEWDSWNRERSAGRTYTGPDSSSPKYGTAGGVTRSSSLAGSEFAKRGGLQEASAEVRGAGPSGRSGGPQKGGK